MYNYYFSHLIGLLYNMKFFLIVIIVLAVFFLGGYFYLQQVNQGLSVQIENWSLYQEIVDPADKFVGSGDCGGQEFSQFKQKASLGSIKKLFLPGNLDLIITPNYDNWTNDQFLALISDSSAICAAGGRYPLKAYPDTLLWSGVCSTGVESENQCQKSAEMINRYYKR